jgi:hypothetical protein
LLSLFFTSPPNKVFQILPDLFARFDLSALLLLLHPGVLVGYARTSSFAAFAQFELEIMKERQREGIADAKAAGKYKGRKPTARAKAADAVKLFKNGKRVSEVAKALSIGRACLQGAGGCWAARVSVQRVGHEPNTRIKTVCHSRLRLFAPDIGRPNRL